MKDFKLNGWWRLPTNPSKHITGILEFIHNKGATLVLFGSFKDLKDINTFFRHDIIQGLTIEGKKLTLYNCLETDTKYDNGILKSTYYVNTIIEGENFNSIEEICFKEIAITLSHLDEWVGISGINVENQIQKKKSRLIKYDVPKLKEYSISESISLEFQSHGKINFERLVNENKPMDFNIKQYFEANFKFKENLETLLEIIKKFSNLLTLINDELVFITSIVAIIRNNNAPYQRLIISSKLYENFEFKSFNPYNIFASYVEIDNLENHLIKWFDIENNFKPLIHLFFGHLYNKNIYYYHSFLNLVQALEFYHRKYYHEQMIVSQNEFEVIKNKIELSLEDTEKWIMDKLRYANEFSLNRRLKQIINDNELLKKFFKNNQEIKEFVFKTKETRNYLTHHDNKEERIIFNENEIYLVILKLELFIKILLLKDLGFEITKIENWIRNHQLYKMYIVESNSS